MNAPLSIKVTVTTAGTPVQVTATSTLVHRVMFEPLVANSGKSYVGNSSLSVSTGAGLTKTFLPAAASGVNDRWELSASGGDSIDVSQFYIDVQTSGQGMVVSYAIR